LSNTLRLSGKQHPKFCGIRVLFFLSAHNGGFLAQAKTLSAPPASGAPTFLSALALISRRWLLADRNVRAPFVIGAMNSITTLSLGRRNNRAVL
jgi:hypothetical protein